MKILYIVDLLKKVKVVYDLRNEVHEKSCQTFLNELCLEDLSTFRGRIDAVKKMFLYKYNVPLFVNEKNIFLKVMASFNVWINIVEIDKIYRENEKVIITFLSGKVLKINTSYRTFMKNYKKIDELYKYVKKNK